MSRDRSSASGLQLALTSTLAFALLLSVSAKASAQDHPLPATNGAGYELRLFRPAVDSHGQITVNGTEILGRWDFAVGLMIDWAHDLARLGAPRAGSMETTGRPLVENMFSGTFAGNVGLFNWLVFGVQLPVHLLTGPSGDNGLGPETYNAAGNGPVWQGFGDLGLHLKLRILRVENLRVGLAAIVSGGIPLGSPSRAFAGDPGYSLWPRLVLEVRPISRLRINLEGGYRHVFGSAPSTLFDATAAMPDETRVTWGSPITAGAAVSVRVLPVLDVIAESYLQMYTNALGNPRAMPWEVIGGLKLFVVRHSYLTAGAGTRIPLGDSAAAANIRAFLGMMFEPSIPDTDGDGLRDDVDRCPTRPEDFDNFQDSDGCPDPDNDNDGILDVDDQCPNLAEDRDGRSDQDGCPENEDGDRDGDGVIDRLDRCPDRPEDRDQFEDTDGCPDEDNDRDGVLDRDDSCINDPEDRDGFEDSDGCPEPDNDRDRIVDSEDRCPNDPETYNGESDDDGCPDQGRVVLVDNQIRILDAINFETGSARIRADSMPVVEAVARTLVGNPQIRRVEVQGHADERGNDETNHRLTRDRAAAVVEALADRNVDRSRLQSAGYGERCPFNRECWATGRRAPRWCHSRRGWDADRRVVFLILETDAGPSRVRIACPAGEDLIPEADRSFHNPAAP